MMRFLVSSLGTWQVDARAERFKHCLQYSTLSTEVTILAQSEDGSSKFGLSEFLVCCMTIRGAVLCVPELLEIKASTSYQFRSTSPRRFGYFCFHGNSPAHRYYAFLLRSTNPSGGWLEGSCAAPGLTWLHACPTIRTTTWPGRQNLGSLRWSGPEIPSLRPLDWNARL